MPPLPAQHRPQELLGPGSNEHVQKSTAGDNPTKSIYISNNSKGMHDTGMSVRLSLSATKMPLAEERGESGSTDFL